ncbi:MAG TPA: acetyl ornithine aminotransferase family protein [Candidatus Thermoplasmatota archaeon]|jgi:4-aminobutyrate aminotransferase|nr:acetyl ornithine aminotransferase family protein [Candidatus Thermoplasmatota archaeon]
MATVSKKRSSGATGANAPRVPGAVPGPKAQDIVARDERFLATSTKTAPVAIERAEGVWLHGVDGEVWIDFCSAGAVVSTGHSHPRVVQAIQEQAGKFLHFMGTDFYYDLQVQVAERLVEVAPGKGAKKVFFTNSGTEAVEAALKLVRWSTRKPQVLGFHGAFHGRTLGALAVTASKRVQRERYFPLLPGATHVPFPNPYRNVWGIDGYDDPDELSQRALDYIETQVLDALVPPSECGAILVEPVQGEGGYVVPPKPFLGGLAKLAKHHDILLLADEVQTGNGRTGKYWAVEHSGVAPDVLITAKGVASGMPMGAIVFRKELDWGANGAHSNTYGGNPVVMAAAMASMDVIRDERLVENAARVGEHMLKRLKEFPAKFEGVGDARGLGLMGALEFVKDKSSKKPDPKTRDAVEELLWKRGVVTLGCGKSSLRFAPPLIVTREQVDLALDLTGECLRDALR